MKRVKLVLLSLFICLLCPVGVKATSNVNTDNKTTVNTNDNTDNKTTDNTNTNNTAAILYKPEFNDARVSDTGVITLKIRKKDTYDNSTDDLWYGSYNDEDDESSYYYDNKLTPKGFELSRSNDINGVYNVIATGELKLSNYGAEITDQNVVTGTKYYYKARYTAVSDNVTVYSDYSEPFMVTAVTTPNKIKSVKATKAKTFTITWNTTTNVDGYNIYVKKFDNNYLSGMHFYNKLELDGIENDSYEVPQDVKNIPFTLVDSVSSSTSSYKYKNASHGMGYIFAIRTYKLVGGNKVESSSMYAAHGVMDYYYCYNAENPKFEYKWPKNEKQARRACKTITVKVWDFKNRSKHSGAKMTRTLWITVNKKYAATIKQIYKDIYKDKSKPPIYEAGSYRWRPEESTWSYHTVGTAIDMNCNENPMYKTEYKKNGKIKKKIVVGSFYKPKSNPYSFPRNGVVENTFAKYGFYRLDHDLMHFNADYLSSNSNYNYKNSKYY